MERARQNMKDEIIHTPVLQIKDNIMSWDSTMIQLSNIAFISTAEQPPIRFPIPAMLLILAGLLYPMQSVVFSLVLIFLGGFWLFIRDKENQRRRKCAILVLRMNSGHNLYFAFADRDFLCNVLAVLQRVITDRGKKQVAINVENCTFSGDTEILNGICV